MKKHIIIYGRVQGVGFRHFIKTHAKKLGVNGWAKNLDNGTVEAMFEGDEQSVQQLIERCRKGPVTGFVEKMDIEDEQGETSYSGFKIVF